jgi:predicted metal-dependent hydrolase
MLIFDYPEEYIHYLAEYNGSRDYFECHEIMEEYWKEHQDSPYKTCWLVLIRIPVCLYHARRGNWTGALKLMKKAVGEADAQLFDELGLDGTKLTQQLKQLSLDWSREGVVYADIDLPITDAHLREAAEIRCKELGYTWGIHGLDAGEAVIHRHRLRDRSDVLSAREQSAKLKAFGRGNLSNGSH